MRLRRPTSRAELPLQVICEMIGVPHDDRHLVFDWSNRMVGFDDPEYRNTPEDGEMAAAEIYAYCDASSPRSGRKPARRHHERCSSTPRSTASG